MRNIKRFLSLSLCILLIISALPLTAGASGETIEWMAGNQESDGHDVFFYCTTVTGNSATIYELGNREGKSIVLSNNNHYVNYDVTASFTGTYILEAEASSHESKPEVLHAYANDEEIGTLNIADGGYVNYTEGYRTIGTVEMTQGEAMKISFSNKTADNSGNGSGATMVCIKGLRLTYAGEAGGTEEPKEENIIWKAGHTNGSGELADGYADIPYTIELNSGEDGVIGNLGSDYSYQILFGEPNHKICYEVTPKYTGIYSLKVQAGGNNSLKAFVNGALVGELPLSTGEWNTYCDLTEIAQINVTGGEKVKIAFCMANAGLVGLQDISLTYTGDENSDEPEIPDEPDTPDNPTEEPEAVEWMAGYVESDGHDIFYYITLANGNPGIATELGNRHGDSMVLDSNNHKLNYDVTTAKDGVYTLEVEASTSDAKPEVLYAYANDEEIGTLEIADGTYISYAEGYRAIGTVNIKSGESVKISFANRTAEDDVLGKGLICIRGIKLTYKEELPEVEPDEPEIPDEPDTPDNPTEEPEVVEWMAGYAESDGHDIFYYITLLNGNAGQYTELGNRHGDSMVLDSNNHKLNYDVTTAKDGVYTLEVEASTNEAKPEVLYAYANDEEIGTLEIADGGYVSYAEGYRAIGTVNMKAGERVKISFANRTAEDAVLGKGLICIRGIKLTYKEELPEVEPDEPGNPDEPDAPDTPDNPTEEAESIEWKAGYQETDGHDIFYYVTLASGNPGEITQLGNREGDSIVFDSNNHCLNYDVTAAKDGVYTLEVEASTNEAKPEVLYAFADDDEIGTLEIADGGYVSYAKGYREIGTVKMRAGRSVKIGFSNKTAEDSTIGKNVICLRGIKLTYKEALSQDDIENDPLTPPQLDVANVTVYKGQVGEVKLNLSKKGSSVKEYTVKVICPSADVASKLTFDAPDGFAVTSNVMGATVKFTVTGINKSLYDFGTINYFAYENVTFRISAEMVYDVDGSDVNASVPEVSATITTLINTNNGGSGSSSGISMSGGGGGGGFKPSQTVPQVGAGSAVSGSTNGFTDLGSVSWAEGSIMNLYNKGIISKASDGRFRPDDSVTRAEFVKMLVTALGITSNGKSPALSDVSSSDWYYTYVSVAVENGLVLGDEKGNFRPNDKITRQDICVIVSRAMDILGYTQPDSTGERFYDDSAISDYAKSAVYRMRTHEIVNGVGMGNFDPLSDATRAATAKIIDTFMKEANI